MSTALPPEIITTVTSASRRHYRLPRYKLQAVAFAFFSLSTANIFISAFFWFFSPPGSPFDSFFMVFPLLLLLLFSLVLAFTGLLFYAGHFEIELRDNSLIRIIRLGPFRFAERRSLRGVQQFTVIRFEKSENNGYFRLDLGIASINVPLTGSALDHENSFLRAEWANSKTLILAFAYPQRLMLPLANELSQYCQLQQHRSYSQPNALAPRVIEESEDPEEFVERPEKPVKSTAILEQHLDSVTITVPALGLRRSWSSFLGLFTLGWNGFNIAFSASLLPALLAGEVEGDAWVGWIILPLFWMIGIGFLLGIFYRSKRSAVLTVTKDSLAILQIGLFGKSQHEWLRRDLENVGVVSKPCTDSDTDCTFELNIQPKKGKPYELLNWRDKAELEWIATVLHQVLNLQFKQFSSVGQRLSHRKPPSPISRWANRVLTIVFLLGMGVGWEIREGVNKAGETVILKNGPIFVWQWHNAPLAGDVPEAKHYVSIEIRRWYVYGSASQRSWHGDAYE